MKQSASSTIRLLIFIALIIPFLSACQPALQGNVKSGGAGIENVRVSVAPDNSFEACSQGTGWYNFTLPNNSDKVVYYRKTGYQMKQITVTNIGNILPTTIPDVSLAPSTTGKEIHGYIGANREGVIVKLSQLTCGGAYSEIASMITCSDGKYSFSGLPQEDGTVKDLGEGTYKVEVSCNHCFWSGQNTAAIDNIPVDNSAAYDFNSRFTVSCEEGPC